MRPKSDKIIKRRIQDSLTGFLTGKGDPENRVRGVSTQEQNLDLHKDTLKKAEGKIVVVGVLRAATAQKKTLIEAGAAA